MKILYPYVSILVFAGLCQSCNKTKTLPDWGGPSPYSWEVDIQHYAQGYWIYDGLTWAGTKNGYVFIGLDMQGSRLVSYKSENDDLTLYESLCADNGDEDYSCRRSIMLDDSIYRIFSAFDITSVDVISDAAFDAAHPAGCSLADVTYLCVATAKPYVDSRYQLYPIYDGYSGGSSGTDEWYEIMYEKTLFNPWKVTSPYSTIIIKHLDEITGNECRMAGIQSITRGDYDNGDSAAAEDFVLCLLSFDMPAVSRSHNFTATFTFDEGRQMSVTFPMDWSE